MKNSQEFIDRRRQNIEDLLQEHEALSVAELAQAVNFSELTIRRDLIYLEKKGVIERFHGGAKAISKQKLRDTTRVSNELERIKHAIAKVTATLIKDNDTIFINTSTTSLLTLQYINAKRINVMTNNVKVIMADAPEDATIFLSGGEVRFPKEALVGDVAINTFSKVSSDITILGCSGFSVDEGITTPVIHEAKVNETMLKRSKGLKVLVADYRKIGYITNYVCGPVTAIDVLITDSFVDENLIAEIKEAGVEVIQVAV